MIVKKCNLEFQICLKRDILNFVNDNKWQLFRGMARSSLLDRRRKRMSNGYNPHVPPPPHVSGVEDKASGMAVTALVLGILSPFCCGLLSGIPALIIGWIERGKIQRGESSIKGNGFALAGIILGAIGIFFSLVWMVIYIMLIVSEASRSSW
jgi:hypothetical protein